MYAANWSSDYRIEDVVDQLRALHAAGGNSFVTGPVWTEAWLRALPEDRLPLLLRLDNGDGSGAISLLGARRIKRFGLTRPVLHLHETGDATLDQMTVEYNGPPLGADAPELHLRNWLQALTDCPRPWAELRISGIESRLMDRLAEQATALGLQLTEQDRSPFYFIELGGRDIQDHLENLSANSRYQLRRAMRLYKQRFGELRVEEASGTDQAQQWLYELIALHQALWTGRGMPGAFGSELQKRFHQILLEVGMRARAVQLLRISAGGQLIGLLYNFIDGERVLNYQSGFVFGPDNRFKPGMVGHLLAAQHNRQLGARVYDLLAGHQRYKRSLATGTGEMAWIRLQRPGLTQRWDGLVSGIRRRLG